jgi:hypothetical protein
MRLSRFSAVQVHSWRIRGGMRSRHAESTVNSEVLHVSQLLKWGRALTVSSDSAFDLDALHGTALFDTERDC